ncbi:hypothetical protein DE4576_03874 [Mycobacterium marinum]|nr:hypothetical protein DE4576_03874 [Mycobacterium marinum]
MMEVVVAPVASAVSGSMAQVVTEAMAGQAERGAWAPIRESHPSA